MDSQLIKPNIKKFILALITFFTFCYSEADKCRTYKCGDLDTNECLSLNSTINEVTGELCQNSELRCPYNYISSNNKIYCEKPKNLPVLQYPGGKCEKNEDCMNGKKCEDNKCQGIAEGESCLDSSDCFFGFSCYINKNATKTCNRLRPKGDNCTAEDQCQMNQGCFHGVCTDYFSLPDKTNLRPNNIDNQYSFCESGHDLYGYCDSLRNINSKEEVTDELVECDEDKPCRYTSINGTVTQRNLCKCGKNPDGKKYCPIFGGNINFSYSVKKLKNLVNGDKSQCNTIERGVVCNAHLLIKDQDKNAENGIISFNTITTKLNSYHFFANAEECIRKIYYPLYIKESDPDPVNPEGKCPIYKCNNLDNTGNKTCASNYYDGKEKKFYVDLFKYSCDWDFDFCNFDRTYVKQVYKNSQCQRKDKNTGKRFPGERCHADSDCFIKDGKQIGDLGKCRDNICRGITRGENCTDTSQCMAGNFCNHKKHGDKIVSKCEAQLKEGEDCNSMFDCRNNFICKDKKCKNQFFMMKTGQKYNHSDYSESDKNYLNKLCETQMISTNYEDTQSTCITKRHVNATDPKQSDLVPCNLNQKCFYNVTDDNKFSEIKTEECQCGYNDKAQGYCPSTFNASN